MDNPVVAADRIDGIINLDKPLGITSAKAVYKVRAITRVRKSGHAGTLDPAAAGVLLVCQGKATKLVERIMDLPKQYRATARLDVTSVSFDSGYPLEPMPVVSPPSVEQVREACTALEGEIEQEPPRISAIKLGGVPAYKTARSASPPVIRPRPVRVYWIHVHSYDWPALDFEIACGRGTYVRALIRDIGLKLGTGGCLTSLVRTAVGPFTQRDAWTLDRMADAGIDAPYLIPLELAASRIEDGRMIVPPRPN